VFRNDLTPGSTSTHDVALTALRILQPNGISIGLEKGTLSPVCGDRAVPESQIGGVFISLVLDLSGRVLKVLMPW
jgi:hypothetical protein